MGYWARRVRFVLTSQRRGKCMGDLNPLRTEFSVLGTLLFNRNIYCSNRVIFQRQVHRPILLITNSAELFPLKNRCKIWSPSG